MLFVSGERTERFPKALAAGADLVCIDLEDAVHPERKTQARREVFEFASTQRQPRTTALAVRLNGLRTREGLADVAALVASGAHLDVLLLPKIEEPGDLGLIHAWAGDQFDALVPLIETPLGIERAALLAGCKHNGAPKLAALMLGGADLVVELGAAFDWSGLLHARGRLVNAARSAGLQVWDVPHLDLGDLAGLTEETRNVLRLGFTCKSAIHPSQVAAIHAAFEPAEAEVQWARALVAAHAEREAGENRAGAFLYQGRMVDPPVLQKAQRIVQLADAARAHHSAAPAASQP
jgi:citrate lyase beta subunit